MTSALPNVLATRCPRSIATATSRPRPRQRNSASSCAPLVAASRNLSRGSGRRAFRTPTPWASADEHAPSRAFFSTYGSADLRSNVFLMILVGRPTAPWARNAESSLPERAMTTANTCGDMQRRVPAKGPAFVIAASTEAARTVTTKPETLRISVETAGPDRDAEGFPDRLSARMAVALSSRGRMPETASTMRLTAQARRNRHAPYPGTGRNRRQGDVFRDAFKERGRGQRPPTEERSGSRAWERASRPMCDGHSRKSFSSRALEIAATRPVARSYPSVMRGLSPTRSASNGCTRRFSPSAPQE